MMTLATNIVFRLQWLWRAILIGCLVQVGYWAVDRSSPFKLISYTTTSAPPGGSALVVAKVRRDLARDCSVVFSRHMFDASGARFDIVSGQFMSAYALRLMDALTPNELRLRVDVPASAAPGLAHVFSTLEYSCNPFHRAFAPIEVTMELDFIIEKP